MNISQAIMNFRIRMNEKIEKIAQRNVERDLEEQNYVRKCLEQELL